jgi:hypothetical protein
LYLSPRRVPRKREPIGMLDVYGGLTPTICPVDPEFVDGHSRLGRAGSFVSEGGDRQPRQQGEVCGADR